MKRMKMLRFGSQLLRATVAYFNLFYFLFGDGNTHQASSSWKFVLQGTSFTEVIESLLDLLLALLGTLKHFLTHPVLHV